MAATGTSEGLAVAYIEAVGQKRFDTVRALLHPDIEFHTPGKTMRGVNEYGAALQSLAPILARNDVKRTVADGNDVCVLYDFVTDTSAGAVPSVEWITVEGGRIRTVRLLFEKAQWPTVVAELKRRAGVGPI